MKTAEQIAEEVSHLEGRANVKAINHLYKQQENEFQFARAIKQVRAYVGTCGERYGLAYCQLLEQALNTIANETFA